MTLSLPLARHAPSGCWRVLPVARPARVWRALEPPRAAFAQHGGAKPCGKTWRCNPAPPRLQDRGDAEAELLLVWRPLETAPPAAGDGGDAAAGDEGGASPEVARDARLRACRAAALAAAAARVAAEAEAAAAAEVLPCVGQGCSSCHLSVFTAKIGRQHHCVVCAAARTVLISLL